MSMRRVALCVLTSLTVGVAVLAAPPGGSATAGPAPSRAGLAVPERASGNAALESGPPACDPGVTDKREPLCNPHLASSTWAMGHRNSYAQATTALAGPRAGEAVKHRYYGLGTTAPGVMVGALFSSPYPDGKRVAWSVGVIGVDDNPIYKIDPQTKEVIDVYTHLTDEGELPRGTAALSGIYVIVDRDNHLIQPRGRTIEVYGDARPGDRMSPIASLHRFRLPARAFCGRNDSIVGQTMLWNGRVAFVTEHGMVGTVPRQISRMNDKNLVMASINTREECASGEVSKLETVSNSLAADETGGIFPVTDHAQYRYNFRDGKLTRAWRMPYQRGSGSSATRQDAGSGSTPTLMGTQDHHDKFVVITDGQDLTHLVLAWRGKIPKDWKGLPGRPRRMACEFPIDFGDPSRRTSSSEQSVVVRGYASLVPNNELRNTDMIDPLLAPFTEIGNLPLRLAVAGYLGQSPRHAPHGFERIDWDPQKQRCRTVWVNKQVSLPNGVPSMSAKSGLVYGIGQRNGVWGLEGLDYRTGKSALWVRGSANLFENPYYSGLQTAPDGSLWSGANLGFAVYSPVRGRR